MSTIHDFAKRLTITGMALRATALHLFSFFVQNVAIGKRRLYKTFWSSQRDGSFLRNDRNAQGQDWRPPIFAKKVHAVQPKLVCRGVEIELQIRRQVFESQNESMP